MRKSFQATGAPVPIAWIAKERAEELKALLVDRRVLDKDRRIVERGGEVGFPLLEDCPTDALEATGARLESGELPVRPRRRAPLEEIRRRAPLPAELLALLPTRWEQFGTVVILKLPKELEQHRSLVGQAYAGVLRASAVLADRGGIRGPFREPLLEPLWGTETVTLHRENGVLYRFDAAALMFSSGNLEERLRMARLRCEGETVIDLFAGIGQLSLPIAVRAHPRKVVACELNPRAAAFLRENIALNGVGDRMEVFAGDNRDLPLRGVADRVVLGYLRGTSAYLPKAFQLLRPEGGTLHYHETCPEALLPARPWEAIQAASGGRQVELLQLRRVKSFSPGIAHVVLDVRVGPD